MRGVGSGQSRGRRLGEVSGDSPAEPSLTLVIPAYNESARIADTVRRSVAWLAHQPFASQLLVVDDGSSDDTFAIARRATDGARGAQVLRIPHGGKAAAVRAGMEAASTDQIAFSDADLATPLDFLLDLRVVIASGCDVAIGSREGVRSRRFGEPSYRHVMGRVFNGLVRLLLLPGLHDTQCGFKLFRADVARELLGRSRLYRDPGRTVFGPRVTAFDVELLTITQRQGYRICPVDVDWTYGSGSKVRPAHDTWHNVSDVLRVWANAKRGRYE